MEYAVLRSETWAAYHWLKVLTEGRQPMPTVCQQSIRLISRASGSKRSKAHLAGLSIYLQAFPCILLLQERHPSSVLVDAIRCLDEEIYCSNLYRIAPRAHHSACDSNSRPSTSEAPMTPVSYSSCSRQAVASVGTPCEALCQCNMVSVRAILEYIEQRTSRTAAPTRLPHSARGSSCSGS